jgi:hypothetical protein
MLAQIPIPGPSEGPRGGALQVEFRPLVGLQEAKIGHPGLFPVPKMPAKKETADEEEEAKPRKRRRAKK